MAVEVRTAPATQADALVLAGSLRPEDELELRAATGRAPLPVLVEAVTDGEAWATYFGDELACIWGVSEPSVIHRRASAWLLTSQVVERYPVAFWKLCLRELPRLLERFGALWNFMDVRHTKAIRWAERLGFELDDPAPYGALGALFRRFVITQEGFACALQR